jgi:large subunit ribosomal protein L18
MRLKNPQQEKNARALRRRLRVRATVSGTAARPRLSVNRSLLHVRVQLIDDVAGKTIVGVSDVTLQKTALVSVGERKGKIARAYAVGRLLAEQAKAQGVTTVVFDRGGRQYHGRVAAVAEGARDGGLLF